MNILDQSGLLRCELLRYCGNMLDQSVLCISTSFPVLRTPESWLKYLFSRFQLVHFQMCFLFQQWNHWKSFKMNKKGWNGSKNVFLTSFWVRKAPKSWLKYTYLRVMWWLACTLWVGCRSIKCLGECPQGTFNRQKLAEISYRGLGLGFK